MKYISFTFCAMLLLSCNTKKSVESQKSDEQIIDTHNSMNSLDWAGIYTGVLPCADCEGLETVLTLNEDLSYVMQRRYKGKEKQFSSSSGQFSWGATGQIVTLDQKDEERYFVGENNVRKLDLSGEKITGDLAQHYVLSKEYTKITDSHWSLVSLNGQSIDFDKKKGNIPYFILRPSEKNVVYGNSGCNRFSGTYTLGEGQQLQLSKMMSTKMACENMDLEQRFLEVIAKIDNYSINRDTLTLQKAKMAPLAKFVKAYFQ